MISKITSANARHSLSNFTSASARHTFSNFASSIARHMFSNFTLSIACHYTRKAPCTKQRASHLLKILLKSVNLMRNFIFHRKGFDKA